MKKRILVISDLPVVPANAGNKTRVWTLMKNLRRLGHDVWFLGLGLYEGEAAALKAAWGGQVHNIPACRARHARPRWFALKRFLTDRLIARGIGAPGVDHWYWPHWDTAIAHFAAGNTFDAVIVEYVFYSRALQHFGPEVCKIIDTHDVYTGRREKLKARKIKRFYQYLTRASEEARGLNRADIIIAIQANEAGFFRKLLGPSKRVITVGHTVEVQPVPRTVRADILFLGSPYTANVDGVRHFIEKSFPRIRQSVPEARLLLAGTICRVLRPEAAGVVVLGEVADTKEAYARAAVVINPVLAGTGLKTKSIEALAYGCPLVTTSCGAEGLTWGAEPAFLVADNPAHFADAVIQLLTMPKHADRIARAALNFVDKWNRNQMAELTQLLNPVYEFSRNTPNGADLPSQPAAEIGDVRAGSGHAFAKV